MLSTNHCLPPWNMKNKTAMNERYFFIKFQVGYMLNSVLKIKKAFREQVESNMALTFSYKTMTPIRKVLRKENTCVISLLIFYENRKNMIFKVLSSVIYCIIANYECDDYLCFTQTTVITLKILVSRTVCKIESLV